LIFHNSLSSGLPNKKKAKSNSKKQRDNSRQSIIDSKFAHFSTFKARNETSPPMEGRSFLMENGFFLASFIPAHRGAGYSEARNKNTPVFSTATTISNPSETFNGGLVNQGLTNPPTNQAVAMLTKKSDKDRD
jgi:hypothetical protein